MSHNKKIYCNKCGKEIIRDVHGNYPDHLHVEKQWGFFSDKDMEIHEWNLCEECYDKFLKKFVIPASAKEALEL